MPRMPSFRYRQTPKGWLVHIPASLSETGALTRKYFPSREKAQKFAADLREEYRKTGSSAPVIPPRLADDALAASRMLETRNLTLREVVRQFVEAERILGGAGTVTEAARAFRASHEMKMASEPMAVALKRYFASRSNLRAVTLGSYRYTLEKVLQPLHAKTLAEITTGDIESLLADKGGTSSALHVRNLRVFWNWVCSPPRSWASAETVSAIETSRTSEDSDIRVLSPSDVRSLLQAAEAEGPACAVAYAIAVFGGVRMGELTKLTWRDIGEEYIEIGRNVAKKHSRRLIPVCETLFAWLSAYRDDAPDSSPVVPANWPERSKVVRRVAGWQVVARLLDQRVKAKHCPAPSRPTRGKWPTNACRHTCASVQVAIGTPLDDLVFKFGHSGGHDLLRRHYVARMTRKDALEILSIGPNNQEIQRMRAV